MVGCMFTAVMCCIADFRSFKYCPILHLDALGSLRNFEVKLYPGAGCLCVLKFVDLSWSTWVYRSRFWSPATVGSSRGLESFRSLKSFTLEWSCMSVLCLCDRLGPHHGPHNETMQSCGFGRKPCPGSILSQCFFPLEFPSLWHAAAVPKMVQANLCCAGHFLRDPATWVAGWSWSTSEQT